MGRDSNMNSRLQIAYFPFENKSNRYTDNFKKILLQFGDVAEAPPLKKVLLQGAFKRYDVLILNWTDNNFVNARRGTVSLRGMLKEFFRIGVYKLIARKTVFVRHNVYPHDALGHHRAKATRLVELYEKCFDLCWVHSGHMAEDHRHYVPHPLYEVEQAPSAMPAALVLPERYFVVFGRIQSYKKIDRLIEMLPADVHILVCGTCPDQGYKKKLQSFNKPNVTIMAEFISDELARDLLVHSSGMLICHSDDDMIVSGSIVFAISIGVPVFAVETPFITWFRQAVNDRMIVAATDFADLIDKMRMYQARITDQDIAVSQAHFSEPSVTAHVAATFNRLDLIPAASGDLILNEKNVT
jgi:glycosyltransferase involved in cell wall biosynthesis